MAIACFDIGGTQIKSAIITSDKSILKRYHISTPSNLKDLIKWMKDILTQNSNVKAISISVPGAVDYKTGYIKGLSAIEYIHTISWYHQFEEFNIPVYIENDANCVGLSQLAQNSHPKNFACVVIGTGIGGALIINEQIVRGRHSYGGEFGYMIVDGLSSQIKNWSKLASTGNLVLKIKQLTEIDDWDGEKVFYEAKNGNKICQQAISDMLRYLAIGFFNLFYIFEPEIIYIGGGISQNVAFLSMLKDELKKIRDHHSDSFPEVPKISVCHFMQDANLMGAFMNAIKERSYNDY